MARRLALSFFKPWLAFIFVWYLCCIFLFFCCDENPNPTPLRQGLVITSNSCDFNFYLYPGESTLEQPTKKEYFSCDLPDKKLFIDLGKGVYAYKAFDGFKTITSKVYHKGVSTNLHICF